MEIYSANHNRIIEDFYFEEIVNEKGSAWLIERIFNIGTTEDVRAIRKYYGDERIKEEVVKIQWLSKETLSFLSGIYEIPKESFLTYQLIHRLK
jgi:hypothetical protein